IRDSVITSTTASRPPATPQEKVLCGLVAELLGLPEAGPDDNFFELGGDSIVSIQLTGRARAAGLALSPKDVFGCATLAELAARAGAADDSAEEAGAGIGEAPLTPIMHWLRATGGPVGRYSQGNLLRVPEGLREEVLTTAVQALIDRHDVLRARFEGFLDRAAGGGASDRAGEGGAAAGGGSVPTFEVRPVGTVRAEDVVRRIDATGLSADAALARLTEEHRAALDRLDPATGAVLQVLWLDTDDPADSRLLIVGHHLVVDGVSWRVLLPDLAAACRAAAAGETPALEPVRTSYRRWARQLLAEAGSPARTGELALWTETLTGSDPLLPDRPLDPARDTRETVRHLDRTLPVARTAPLLTDVPGALDAGVNDILLTALSLAVTAWRERSGADPAHRAVLVALEGHGREEQLLPGADLSRTVGWFTSVHPVRLDPGPVDVTEALAGGGELGDVLKRVRERLRAIPDSGIGYGLLRHLNPETAAVLARLPQPEIEFNYLGRFTTGETATTEFALADEAADFSDAADPRMPAGYSLDINAYTLNRPDGPELHVRWSWPAALLGPADVEELADLWFRALDALTRHARQQRP
ncbi:condensation domain-containing protein, partial [Streptomyces sp. URMC 123]|uniref:condensation domain-containing protein n=1 Tax=Streptomyces sp. URMC 123 TaxID=3423403 RepID=UPI003F1D0A4E